MQYCIICLQNRYKIKKKPINFYYIHYIHCFHYKLILLRNITSSWCIGGGGRNCQYATVNSLRSTGLQDRLEKADSLWHHKFLCIFFSLFSNNCWIFKYELRAYLKFSGNLISSQELNNVGVDARGNPCR